MSEITIDGLDNSDSMFSMDMDTLFAPLEAIFSTSWCEVWEGEMES